MKKGGYLIIDLLNHKLSDTPVIIEGVYNTIADNDEKMLLISGMMEDEILYDDMVGFAVPNGDTFEVTVGTKKLTITVDDEITISNAGGGGGGSVNVINSLTSDSTSDALSAKQGKVLKGLVDDKLPINQGSENAGKYLKVADDGSVEYAAGGGGGSVSVIDNLTSDSSTDALSAKQGKALKTLIDTESGTRLSADTTLEIEIDNINGSADPWENTKNYVKGDLVLYSSKLFMCISNNINQAPAEGTYWTRVSLGNFGGFQFRDNNGIAEYRKSGADTWSPFKSGQGVNKITLNNGDVKVINTGLSHINRFLLICCEVVNSEWIIGVMMVNPSLQLPFSHYPGGGIGTNVAIPTSNTSGRHSPLILSIDGGDVTIAGTTYGAPFNSDYYWIAE